MRIKCSKFEVLKTVPSTLKGYVLAAVTIITLSVVNSTEKPSLVSFQHGIKQDPKPLAWATQLHEVVSSLSCLKPFELNFCYY